MRTVYVRADGSERIGMGHLMRMMTITDCLKVSARVIYACATKEAGDAVRERGYSVKVFETDPDRMEEELPAWEAWMREESAAWEAPPILLIDSYAVSHSYLTALSVYGKIWMMDDMMREVFPVDGIINYHCFADPEWYHKMYAEKRCLIGADFVPLRPEFSATDDMPCHTEGNEILITTGGADRFHIGRQILMRIYRKDLIFHVILGRFASEDTMLREFVKGKENIRLHRNVRDMAGLMRRCSFGITAGGSTIYEMSAAMLPMMTFSYAENQEALAEYMGKHGAGFYAGKYHMAPEECLAKIEEGFALAMREEKLRMAWRDQAKRIVDGRGAERIAKELLNDCKS